MKDQDKLKILLGEFGIDFEEYDVSISIAEMDENNINKIRGDSRAGCTFYFDERGDFEFIELTGD